ncbi:hypothetical protein [Phenylobacterium sp. J367]|uniref:hypothetical protein n=1 Tax=Phenylobacterium sp. J367 TaxID=2898435 RepID=UPI002151D99F|nr:hypothetical protein [Phenylobacterium sp. J367]MCR5879874.1 hypothetical protein [Phenylobacterium sp. J367]
MREVEQHAAFIEWPKRLISEDGWTVTYRPLTNPDTESLIYDPFEASDAAALEAAGENHIWTEIDWPDAWGAIMPGRHRFDAIGYIITEQPWAESDRDLLVLVEG